MKNAFIFKAAMCAFGLMLSSSSVSADQSGSSSSSSSCSCDEHHVQAGSLDSSFNPGGPKPGLQVVSMSPFTNFATGVALQQQGCHYKIIMAGDAVQSPNPLEPNTNPCTSATLPVLDGTATVDGFADERGLALVRLNQDGSVDRSFGTNGNGKVFFAPAHFVESITSQHNLHIDRKERILVAFTATTAASDSYGPPLDYEVAAGSIGNPEPYPNNNVDPFLGISSGCNFMVGIEPQTGNPYGQSQIVAARFTPDGVLDANYASDAAQPGLFVLPIQNPGSFGDFTNSSLLDNKGRQVIVGASSPDANGCLYDFPLVTRVLRDGTLDTSFGVDGVVAEGTALTDMSNFTDNTLGAHENLGFAQYEAVTIDHKGRIIAVGDGDTNGFEWPFTARIIAARYFKDGSLDTSFGVNGYLVISGLSAPNPNAAGKQVLARSVAVDEDDNIYIGGDIADIGSGAPGAATIAATGPSELVARPTANFLLIKLNHYGIPQNYGPTGPNACGEGTACLSSVFDSCNSCQLLWGSGQSFRAVTTDFYGHDDAIFSLVVNDKEKTITASGQAAEDDPLQSIRIAFARYKLHDGKLDPSFGSGGLVVVDGGRNRRSLVRDMTVDPCGKLIAAGQSGFSQEEVSVTNFQDATIKDFAVTRVNP